jgi:phosphoribosyl-ATP pyrophosphohydrolase
MKKPLDPSVIAEIWDVIADRAAHPSDRSYTSRLLNDEKGIDRVLEKVGEESIEFILAVKNGMPKRTTEEAADLFYHVLVALRASGVDLADVIEELRQRRR